MWKSRCNLLTDVKGLYEISASSYLKDKPLADLGKLHDRDMSSLDVMKNLETEPETFRAIIVFLHSKKYNTVVLNAAK